MGNTHILFILFDLIPYSFPRNNHFDTRIRKSEQIIGRANGNMHILKGTLMETALMELLSRFENTRLIKVRIYDSLH